MDTVNPTSTLFFYSDYPGLPSDFCTELSMQVNAASSAPRAGVFNKEARKLGAAAHKRPQTKPSTYRRTKPGLLIMFPVRTLE